MSEPKLISPMLDGFAVGDYISSHHGVRCCPAIRQDTDAKYIVKTISVPASQTYLEALLLTGAYASESAALADFQNLAQALSAEVDVLNTLSKLEGFLPVEACQVVPMDDEVGYDVYLLIPYRRSLEHFFRKNTMTHLGAVNLGLDICAALAVARRAGYLYVDLKPGNVFLTDNDAFRIGDLGFVKLSDLNFTSLPDKYRSPYTAPEIRDAYSTISSTADIYAAGLILYQAYNGGVLPFTGDAPDTPLDPPAYADYEMAEIILKACDPDPEQRWADPVVMGQAIVSYMQRNGVNDDPIVPPPVEIPESESAVSEEITETELQEAQTVDTASETEEVVACEEPFGEESQPEECEEDQLLLKEFQEIEETTEESPTEDECDIAISEEESAEESSPSDDPETSADEVTGEQEDDPANLAFMEELVNDDTAPTEETVDEISYQELTGDACDILAQADDFIAHEAPEPAVAPDPIDVPVPEPILIPEEESVSDDDNVCEDPHEEAAETSQSENVQETLDELTCDQEDYPEDEDDYEPLDKRSGKKILAILLTLLLLAGLAFGVYMYYKHFYVQNVTAMTLEGTEDHLYVHITTDVDEQLLTVICTDTHGNRKESAVIDGVAVFSGLNPNTHYKVNIEINGLRKLTGDVVHSYTTPNQTSVINFNAVTGSEEGSVILSFTIDGADADNWTVTYTADGEEVISQVFTDHIVTLTGLTPGKIYNFALSSDELTFLAGNTQVDHLVTAPVYAENFGITSCTEDSITVGWNTPSSAIVESWIVRCYNDSGFDKTITVKENTATFEDINISKAHTIEITAAGMSTGVRCFITEGSVNVSNLSATVDAQVLTVSWNCDIAPAGNWVLIYSVDGSEQLIMNCDGNTAQLSPVIPGAQYAISLQLSDGTTVLGGNTVVNIPEANAFNGHALGYIVRNDVTMQYSMCRRPASGQWSHADLNANDYTTSFSSGENAGFVLHIPGQYNTLGDTVNALFVIRNSDGVPVSWNQTSHIWRDMWYRRYCELDIPQLPSDEGNYTIELYFNGELAHSQEFIIVP